MSALIVWPCVAASIIGVRMLMRWSLVFDSAMSNDVLLVGTDMDVAAFNHQQRSARGTRWNVIKQIDPKVFRHLGSIALADRLDGLAVAYGSRKPITLLILPSDQDASAIRELIANLDSLGRRYVVALDYIGVSRKAVTLRQPLGSDLIMAEVSHTRQLGLLQTAKRAFDLFLAACVLVLLSPIYAIIFLSLAFEGGPIFFSQTRVGRDGVRFNCLKFRTMRTDAQERLVEMLRNDEAAAKEWATHQKLTKDPRITRIGNFLRQTSLDELPQLFNVIRGDMSFVGPRPIIAPEIEGYKSDCAYYHSPEFAHYVACTPGITGPVSYTHLTLPTILLV